MSEGRPRSASPVPGACQENSDVGPSEVGQEVSELMPYTIPEQDADLWDCGVVLTEQRVRSVWEHIGWVLKTCAWCRVGFAVVPLLSHKTKTCSKRCLELRKVRRRREARARNPHGSKQRATVPHDLAQRVKHLILDVGPAEASRRLGIGRDALLLVTTGITTQGTLDLLKKAVGPSDPSANKVV